MKVYCGDYMNHLRPKRRRWLSLGIIGACILFTSAATPAMVSYYWSGQRSTKNLALDEAIRLSCDKQMPEMMRKNAQVEIYLHAKRAVKALQEADTSTEVLSRSQVLLQKKLKTQLQEDK